MKRIVAFCSVFIAGIASAQPGAPMLSKEGMVKACNQAVSEQVAKESDRYRKVWFDVTHAGAEVLSTESFVCLVVGEKIEKPYAQGQQFVRSTRAYSVSVHLGAKSKSRVDEIVAL